MATFLGRRPRMVARAGSCSHLPVVKKASDRLGDCQRFLKKRVLGRAPCRIRESASVSEDSETAADKQGEEQMAASVRRRGHQPKLESGIGLMGAKSGSRQRTASCLTLRNQAAT
jgi:hypothetical protein